jgi:hypothetical protein
MYILDSFALTIESTHRRMDFLLQTVAFRWVSGKSIPPYWSFYASNRLIAEGLQVNAFKTKELEVLFGVPPPVQHF